MLKAYTISNGTEIETVTIPKGTVLFRGLVLDKGMPDSRIFTDMLGYHNGEAYSIPPTQNVFFYPAPYVSQAVDQFNIHVIYITNYDLELLLLIKPSKHHRGERHNDASTISELITTCTNISEKDKCGFQMKSDDACFTDMCIKQFENIKGYIAIANTDSKKLKHQLKGFFKNNINKIHQIMPSISSNAKDDVGVPEIVIHPLHLRRPECETVRKRFITNADYVQYCVNTRAKYNYFPLLYITEKNIYNFDDLREKDCIKSMRLPLPKLYFTDIFDKLKDVLEQLLSPNGYKIGRVPYYVTIDLRTGFYIIMNSSRNSRNKTAKTNNSNGYSFLHYNPLYKETDSLISEQFIIPVRFPKKEKYTIMELIGRNLITTKESDYDYLDTIESKLNSANLSLSSYIFNKGGVHKLLFDISKAIDRPELYKSHTPINNGRNLKYTSYDEFINKPSKTRKIKSMNLNTINLTNLYMVPLDSAAFNETDGAEK